VATELMATELMATELVTELVAPELVAPELVATELVATELVAPELVALELVALELVAPELVATELIAPELVATELVATELVAPELVAQELVAPELVATELWWRRSEARDARRERRGDGSEAVGARRRERCPKGEDGQKRRFPARAKGLIARWNRNQGKGWCAGFYKLTKMPANGEVGSDPRVGVVFQRSAVPPRSACACASWRAGGL
jgi:hypothetical protein